MRDQPVADRGRAGLFSYQMFFVVEPLPSLEYLLEKAHEQSAVRSEAEERRAPAAADRRDISPVVARTQLTVVRSGLPLPAAAAGELVVSDDEVRGWVRDGRLVARRSAVIASAGC